jgi:hypothetical protein
MVAQPIGVTALPSTTLAAGRRKHRMSYFHVIGSTINGVRHAVLPPRPDQAKGATPRLLNW